MAQLREALANLLNSMAQGAPPTAVELTLFSDLEAGALALVRERWEEVPPPVRRSSFARAKELAEDSVELHFEAFARLGLDDSDPAARIAAMGALAESVDRRVATRLGELVRTDADETVRAAAATALTPFVLLRELGEFDPRVGDSIVLALRAAASEAEPSILVRSRAVEAIGPRLLEWVETLISDAYYHEDREMRLAAIRAIGASAQEHWLDFLEEQAQSEDPEFRLEAANAIGALASEDGMETLGALLADEDAEVVLAALVALGDLGGDVAVEMLEQFLRSAEGPAADAAREALEEARFADSNDLMREKVGL